MPPQANQSSLPCRSKLIKYLLRKYGKRKISVNVVLDYFPLVGVHLLYSLNLRDFVISLSLFNGCFLLIPSPSYFCERGLKLQKGAVQAATSKSLQVLLRFSCALIIHQAPSITMYVEIHFRCRVTPYTLHLTIVFFTKRYILLTWRKITAKGSDLEKVSMSASLLKYSFF